MSYYVRELYEHPEVTTDVLAAAGRQAAGLLASAAPGTSAADLLPACAVPPAVRAVAAGPDRDLQRGQPPTRCTPGVLEQIASFEPSAQLADRGRQRPARAGDAATPSAAGSTCARR